MTNVPVDYAPLSEKVGLRVFFAHYKRGKISNWFGLIIGAWLIIVAIVIFTGASAAVADDSAGAVLCFALGCVLFIWPAWNAVERIRYSVYLERFALANGLQFTLSSLVQEQGSIFNEGTDRRRELVVSGQRNGHEFWFGNYHYTTGSGKHRQDHRVGVLNVALPRALPHVIIDGRQNTMHAASGFARSQRLQLEGDFNNYFSVYCPVGYERDVLYFLTPELMQLLVDIDDRFDIEIIERELYFYTSSGIKPRQERLSTLFTLMDTVATEVVENTQRYQDWRIDKKLNNIAPTGKRLKRSVWPAIIMILIILAIFVLPRFVATFK